MLINAYILYHWWQVNPSVKVSATETSAIKLGKAEQIMFFGNSRDFAAFKKDFETIVVPNRAAVDTGYRLRQAIPQKHQHLIANVDVADYKKMLEILSKKFGTKRQVIDSIVNEIEKTKPIDRDNKFVEFVEKVEKIKRDAEATNMISEVATAGMIARFETKLPEKMKDKWSEVVIEENLDDEGKTSKDKFDSFLKFLEKAKNQVEYRTSDARSSEGDKSKTKYCFVTGKTYTIGSKPRDTGLQVEDKKVLLEQGGSNFCPVLLAITMELLT